MNVFAHAQTAVNRGVGRLPITLLALVASLGVAILLWRNSQAEVLSHARARFQFRTHEVEIALRQRMLAYEQVLRGGAGLITLLDARTRDKWRIYVERLQIDRNFPGIQGIGFSERIPRSQLEQHILAVQADGFPNYTVRPPGNREEYTSIVYLEPFDWRNQRAFGYDMFSEPVRHAAMVLARDTGEAALSGKVILVQETEANVQPGFLMYLPAYKKGMATDTVQARRQALVGYVYSPFRARDLMSGIVGEGHADLDLHIYDGSTLSDATLLYDDDSGRSHAGHHPLFVRSASVTINKHLWTIRFASMPLFEASIDQQGPLTVLATGVVISLLLSALLWFLTTSHQLNAELEQRVAERTAELHREIAERQRAEAEILELNQHLEGRVAERTAEIEQMHRQLMLASRQAGMAEVATSVLHNVGNVLNSVNVSATLVADRLRGSKTSGLVKIAGLVKDHENDLESFFSRDPKGRQVPSYLLKLSEHLTSERSALVEEAELLRKNVEHIREIVAMQQNYGRLCGVLESVRLADLVEDSLRINATGISRGALQIVRQYEDVPPLTVDKHQVLQILVNLIRNAQDACQQSGRTDGRLTLSVKLSGDRAQVIVTDNGIGIEGANLTRIFGHGFTTRKNGHGFGLHGGALAAKDLGGALSAYSAGPGQGASFTLELPLAPPKRSVNGSVLEPLTAIDAQI